MGNLLVGAGTAPNDFGVQDCLVATTAATSFAAEDSASFRVPPEFQSVWESRPLNTNLFAQLLEHDSDRDFLLGVLHYGVRLVPPGTEVPCYQGANYSSAVAASAQVSAVIAEERASGRLVPIPQEAALHVHPLGAVPKPPDNGIRVIHDHSYPAGSSLNDLQRYWRLSWDSLDHALQYLVPRVYMAKFDLSAYYRHFPVHPDHWQFQCFSWESQHYLDGFLEFGVRIAPEVAHRFTCALKRILWANGIRAVSAIVDDFLLLHTSKVYCTVALVAALALAQDLGFKVNLAPHKTSLPCFCLKYVGIVVDSARMELRLPADKLAKLVAGCESALAVQQVPIRDLQSLVGLLQWGSKVIFGGRCFMRSLWVLLGEVEVSAPHKRKLRLPAWARQDLQWWISHVAVHNGLLRLSSPQMPVLHLYTDAALSAGPCIGVFCEGSYFLCMCMT